MGRLFGWSKGWRKSYSIQQNKITLLEYSGPNAWRIKVEGKKRYLLNVEQETVWPWTEILEKKPVMVEITEAEALFRLGKGPKPAAKDLLKIDDKLRARIERKKTKIPPIDAADKTYYIQSSKAIIRPPDEETIKNGYIYLYSLVPILANDSQYNNEILQRFWEESQFQLRYSSNLDYSTFEKKEGIWFTLLFRWTRPLIIEMEPPTANTKLLKKYKFDERNEILYENQEDGEYIFLADLADFLNIFNLPLPKQLFPDKNAPKEYQTQKEINEIQRTIEFVKKMQILTPSEHESQQRQIKELEGKLVDIEREKKTLLELELKTTVKQVEDCDSHPVPPKKRSRPLRDDLDPILEKLYPDVKPKSVIKAIIEDYAGKNSSIFIGQIPDKKGVLYRGPYGKKELAPDALRKAIDSWKKETDRK